MQTAIGKGLERVDKHRIQAVIAYLNQRARQLERILPRQCQRSSGELVHT